MPKLFYVYQFELHSKFISGGTKHYKMFEHIYTVYYLVKRIYLTHCDL